MWETLAVILAVAAALALLVRWLARSASGRGGCCSSAGDHCAGCARAVPPGDLASPPQDPRSS
jgi:hypothetical protein